MPMTQLDLTASKDSKIYGSLGSVSLNDILQMMGMARRTGTVEVTYDGREGKIFFEDGKLLHAEAGSVRGEEALARLVRWTHADFVIEDGIRTDEEPSIGKSVDAAMLDVLTRMDEGQEPDVLYTPFPPLDKVDLSALARKVRESKLKPRTPAARAADRITWVGAAVALVGVGAAVALFFLLGSDDLASLPGVAERPAEASAPAGAAGAELLVAAMREGATGAETLLAGYGVDWSAASSAPAVRSPAPAAPAPAAPEAVGAPAAAPAQLVIVVEPWAHVSIDGVDVGETPLPAIEVAPGEHEIVLSNPTRVGLLRDRVTLSPGESRRLLYTMNDTGSLRIVVTPWADVLVDGREVGQTPLGALDLPVGEHRVVLRHPKLGEVTRTVTVRAGTEVLLNVEMKP